MKGICPVCEKTLQRSVIKHILKCVITPSNAIKKTGKNITINSDELVVLVTSLQSSDYYLILKCSAHTQLKHIDYFLRHVWLECCGHLSIFIDRERNEYSKQQKIFELERNDINLFAYEYDMGTTTELLIELIRHNDYDADKYDELMKLPKKADLEKKKNNSDKSEGLGPVNLTIIAQNELPEVECSEPKCKERVKYVYCCDFFCEKHMDPEVIEDIECVPQYVNSPRTGECGYGTDPLEQFCNNDLKGYKMTFTEKGNKTDCFDNKNLKIKNFSWKYY
jgi:hypothetical protein